MTGIFINLWLLRDEVNEVDEEVAIPLCINHVVLVGLIIWALPEKLRSKEGGGCPHGSLRSGRSS
jgi:hypothetical protein